MCYNNSAGLEKTKLSSFAQSEDITAWYYQYVIFAEEEEMSRYLRERLPTKLPW